MALYVARRQSAPAVVVRPEVVEFDPSSQKLRSITGAASPAAAGGGGGGGGGGTPAVPDEGAAQASEAEKAHPTATFAGVAIALLVIGVVVAVALFGTKAGPTFTPAEGIAVFAIFYVIAQAAERIVELILSAVRNVDGLNKSAKMHELEKAIAAAKQKESDKDLAAAAANAQADVDEVVANRSALAFGLTGALGVILCAYTESDFLTVVGVKFPVADGATYPGLWDQVIAMAVTALIIGGGSKALHDTISNISKSSAARSNPPETGGSQ